MAAELPEELLSAVEALRALAARADKAARKEGCTAEAASQHRCLHMHRQWPSLLWPQPLLVLVGCLQWPCGIRSLPCTRAGRLPPWQPGYSCTSLATPKVQRQTQPRSWRASTGTPLPSPAERVSHFLQGLLQTSTQLTYRPPEGSQPATVHWLPSWARRLLG